MNSTNGSEKSHSLQSDFAPETAVRERGIGTIRTLYDSTSTSVFKDSAWNWLIFKALHRGFQTPWTFKGLVKKGLWNFKAFRISFKHSRGLCANPVMSVLHFPNQNPHKQKAAWCISTPKTSLYPLTHSTTPYTFPPFVPATHNPPSHVKGDLNWRRKLAWDLKMSIFFANTDLQALVSCSIKWLIQKQYILASNPSFSRSSHFGSFFTRRLPCGILETFATQPGFVHITDTDWRAQMVFTPFMKNCGVYGFYAIPEKNWCV